MTNQDCGSEIAEVFPQDERKQEERDKDMVSLVFLSPKLEARTSSKGKFESMSCGGGYSRNYFLFLQALIHTLTIVTKHVFNLLQCYTPNGIV